MQSGEMKGEHGRGGVERNDGLPPRTVPGNGWVLAMLAAQRRLRVAPVPHPSGRAVAQAGPRRRVGGVFSKKAMNGDPNMNPVTRPPDRTASRAQRPPIEAARAGR